MKERPILFSTPMVQAERMGNKTQTRRTNGLDIINQDPNGFDFLHCYMLKNRDYFASFNSPKGTIDVKCPFGNIGDVLWVRETWCLTQPRDPETYYFGYKAGGDAFIMASEKYDYSTPDIWKPSIHMPREACRRRLEIINVRVERLNNISESDAIAEGMDLRYDKDEDGLVIYDNRNKIAFEELWESINGKGSWDENPYVWVIEFKRLGGLK